MAKNFWSNVNKVITDSDLVMMVLDARIPELTLNHEIEKKIMKLNRNIIFIINKCDLIDKKHAEEIKKSIPNSVFISTKKHFGATILKKKIMHFASKKQSNDDVEIRNRSLIVAVVGYPNTGKSSVINMLAGKGKTKTSSYAGYTKGLQKVRISPKVMLFDSPGVISFENKDQIKQVILGSLNPANLEDIDLYAYELIKYLNEIIQIHYFDSFDKNLDDENLLIKISEKFNYKKKGNEFDINKASEKLILDWQKGKINMVVCDVLDKSEDF